MRQVGPTESRETASRCVADGQRLWPRQIRRIVLVADRWPALGGGATFIDNFRTMMAPVGVETEVVSLYPGSVRERSDVYTVIHREQLHRGPTLRGAHGASRIPAIFRWVWKSIDRSVYRTRYRRKFQAYGSDTVLLFIDYGAYRELRASGYRRDPTGSVVIGQYHSTYKMIASRPGQLADLAQAYSDIDVLVALSAADAQEFQGVISACCTWARNPARPISRSMTTDALLRRPMHRAVSLARFSPEKRLDFLIRSFSSVTSAPELSDWRLDIYGDGDMSEALRSLVREEKAEDRVRVMKAVRDVESVYREADINLLASIVEGAPMTIVEAAQQCVPTVSFACSPGVREMGSQLSVQLIEDVNDFTAYQNVLARLFADDEAIRELGIRAHSGVNAYDLEVVRSRWATIIVEAIAQRNLIRD